MNNKIIIELDDEKIKKHLKISDVIKTVEEGFRKKGSGLVNLPPKMGPKLNVEGAFADSMTVAVLKDKKNLETFGIKWISGFKDNLKKNLPYLSALIIVNDAKTGLPLAILNGSWITAIRTACVSVVSAKYLAPRKKNITIGVFGLGLQAYSHVLAFKEFYKKNVQFVLYNHDENWLKNFLKKIPREKFIITDDCHDVVKKSDIILSMTPFGKISPYIFEKDLKDDVLLLPIDYGTRIDPKLYKCIDEVYTDDIAQYKLKTKIGQFFSKNTPKIKKEIGDIVYKKYKRSFSPKRILVYNLGIALFDIITADLLIRKQLLKNN